MKKILILFAHPAFHKSRINKVLMQEISGIEGVTINQLYENYPDFFIDVNKEQKLLVEHDVIIWHHPFYWYSAPALIKEWMDLVLEHGFAYGARGRQLEGKTVLSVISTGGSKEVYCQGGRNNFTINQFLTPFEQTANLCRMNYLPPFVVYGSYTIEKKDVLVFAKAYREMLIALRDETIDPEIWKEKDYSNELFLDYA